MNQIPSFRTIDTNRSIELPLKIYSHAIYKRRSSRASSYKYFASQKIKLETLKMRRKSCYCDDCGPHSAFQYKNMNVPLELQQRKQLKRSDSIRKSRQQVSGTTLKATVEETIRKQRRRSTRRPSLLHTSPSNSGQKQGSFILLQPVQLQKSSRESSCKIDAPATTKATSKMSMELKRFTNTEFILKVNGVKINQPNAKNQVFNKKPKLVSKTASILNPISMRGISRVYNRTALGKFSEAPKERVSLRCILKTQ